MTMDLKTAATLELAAQQARQEATSKAERAALTAVEAAATQALAAGHPDEVQKERSHALMWEAARAAQLAHYDR